MFENNHSVPNLVEMTVFVVSWRCPKRIGNNTVKSDHYGNLNASVFLTNLSETFYKSYCQG